jgi:hypothetical protein
MTSLQIVLAAAVAVLLVVAWLALRRRGGRGPEREADRIDTVIGWPPRATRVLSAPERMAFVILARALPDHVVLAQVPLARFISVPKRNSYADWLRRVGYQCADFVVCDTASQVVAVVELQTAQTSDRSRKRMARIARTLKAAQVPLHVWNVSKLPSIDAARAALIPSPPPAMVQAPTPSTSSKALPAEPTFGALAASAGAGALAASAAAAASTPPAPAPQPNPFDDTGRDSTQDERIEFLDPPPTWYDELDSGAAPLAKRE